MALQSSGAISLNDIQTEFGGSNPIGINEYYGVAPGIPASGQISIGDFYGASAGTPGAVPFTLELLVIASGGRAQTDGEAGGQNGGGGAGGMYFVTIPGVGPGTTIPISISSDTTTPYVTVTSGGSTDSTPTGRSFAYPGGSGGGQGSPSSPSGTSPLYPTPNPATTGGLGNDPPLSPAQGTPGFTHQTSPNPKGGGGGGYVSGGPRTTFQHNGGTGYVLNNFVTENLLHGGSPLVPGHPVQVCYGGGGWGPGGAHGQPGWPGLGASRPTAPTPTAPVTTAPYMNSVFETVAGALPGAGFGFGGLGDSSEGREFFNVGGDGAIFIRYPGTNWPEGRITNQNDVAVPGLSFTHPNGTEYYCHVLYGAPFFPTGATQIKVRNAPAPY